MGTNNDNEVGGNGDSMDASVSSSPIQNFFDGSCVLVTGGTGFVGKVLVEKLLRSCLGIRTIYLLIRPKSGVNVQRRHTELLKNSVSMTFFSTVSSNRWKIDEHPPNVLHPVFLHSLPWHIIPSYQSLG
jgi:hypothetical protein